MASKREGIITGLTTLLKTIIPANGFDSDVQDVVEYPIHFTDLDITLVPIISIVSGPETPTDLLGGSTQEYDWRVGLRCYLEGTDQDDIRADAHKLIEDIHKLIYQNPTLSVAGVVLARPIATDPPFIWFDVGSVGLVDLQLLVRYRKDLS